ncbi:MAG: aromatic compound catabolic protein [Burkholderiales bacterium GWF1_66_17]|nr:MAG: aromatic compound catabolic protein [Burkholderiales bacterium GWE1_65_30]OGA93959.1 MAG: aromatic compound catabolic protein [Burkholderiales bacterium GWF1_66_17]
MLLIVSTMNAYATVMEQPMSVNDNLETWLAQEQEILQRLAAGPGPGVARPDQIAGKTGLEVMQAMLQGELPYAAIAQTLDFLIVEVGDGSAIFQGTPGPQHLNPMGTVHGGWFATLLDSALGCAVHTRMPPGRAYTTAELSVNIVRALTPKVPRVRAIGRVVHCGRQLATADAQLVGPDGTLYAHATTTCLVFDLQHKPAGGATT